MSSGRIPRRSHPTESGGSRPSACVAKGTPLSERMQVGKSNSSKARTRIGRLSAVWVLVSA